MDAIMLCGQNAIGADQTVLLQHPGNPLRSSQRNGNMRAAGIGADLTPALEISGSRPRTAPKICSKQVEWRQTVTRYCCHAGACSGGGGLEGVAHSTDGGDGGVRGGASAAHESATITSSKACSCSSCCWRISNCRCSSSSCLRIYS